MFVASYILVLCISAFLLAWALAFAGARLGPALGIAIPLQHGAALFIASLSFLLVAAAPGSVLVASLALFVCPLYWRTAPRLLPPALAVLFALLNLTLPGVAPLPPLAVYAIAGVAWFALTLTHARLPDHYYRGLRPLLAALLPLAAAPLFGGPFYLALDAALIGFAALGTCRVRVASTYGHARLPLTYLYGWLVVTAACHGAYIAAGISAALWLVLLLMVTGSTPPVRRASSHDFAR